MLGREVKYINVTVILSIFLLIFWRDDIEVIVYAFLLIALLLSGNMYSHFYVLEDKERTGVKSQLSITFGSVIGIGALFLFFIFSIRNVFNHIWYGIMQIPTFLAGKMGALFGFLAPEPEMSDDYEDITWEELLGVGKLERRFEELLPEEKNESFFIENYAYLLYWAVGTIILSVIVIMAIRYFRTRFNPIVDSDNPGVMEYYSMDDYTPASHSAHKRLFKEPKHQVRKLIYQFERDAQKADFGRYPYETLDSWMKRMGYNMDMTTYKKVRYGDIEKVSREEVQMLKQDLQTIRNILKN